MIDWEATFKDAHAESWPLPQVSVSVDIFERDQQHILDAAKRHGYTRGIGSKACVILLRKGGL